jgi:hypothetical protein
VAAGFFRAFPNPTVGTSRLPALRRERERPAEPSGLHLPPSHPVTFGQALHEVSTQVERMSLLRLPGGSEVSPHDFHGVPERLDVFFLRREGIAPCRERRGIDMTLSGAGYRHLGRRQIVDEGLKLSRALHRHVSA